jgi:hypothetical protein
MLTMERITVKDIPYIHVVELELRATKNKMNDIHKIHCKINEYSMSDQ